MKRIILFALLVSTGSGGALAHDPHRHHNDSLQLAVTLATGLHYGGHYHSGRYCNVIHYNRYRPATRYYPHAYHPHRYKDRHYSDRRYYSGHHGRHYSGHDQRILRGATLSPRLGGKTYSDSKHSDRLYRSERHRDHRAYRGADRRAADRNYRDRPQHSPRNHN
ncbi:MAG: hypothetical protein WBN40_13240 [Pseudomonadales bacterium]